MKGIERGITMKIKNINNVDKFFEVVDSCKGKVELVTGEGDRLNLKSKLCQYLAVINIIFLILIAFFVCCLSEKMDVYVCAFYFLC